MKVLITGSNGFIGKALCPYLIEKGYHVRGSIRMDREEEIEDSSIESVVTGDIGPDTDWAKALSGVDRVVHLAGRAHITRDISNEPLAEFRKVNVVGTERLAREAAKAGVKRFVFVSSVKVNGEGRPEPYKEDDPPEPEDAYGISKLEAEQALRRISADTGMPFVILRLPLVYGKGVKANFLSLLKLSASGLPLPFKSVNNKRSLLYIGNLINAIDLCLTHPGAVGETFLLSDGQDVSTPELIKMLSGAMNKSSRLFSLPPGFLRGACGLLGKGREIDKLIGSLAVDSGKIRSLLGWNPPYTLEEGIREMSEQATV